MSSGFGSYHIVPIVIYLGTLVASFRYGRINFEVPCVEGDCQLEPRGFEANSLWLVGALTQ